MPIRLRLKRFADREQQILREWTSNERDSDRHSIGESTGKRERR